MEKISNYEKIFVNMFKNNIKNNNNIELVECNENQKVPIFSLKFKDYSIKNNSIKYIFLSISIILIGTIHFLSIPIIIVIYVLLSLIKKVFPKKNNQ